MRRFVSALSGLILVGLAVTGPAQASPIGQTAVVSEDPVSYTPRVVANVPGQKNAVYKMTLAQGTMFAGGDFTEVQDAARTTTYQRKNLFSFDPTSGAVKPLDVSMNGSVWAIASDGTSLYVGGTFSSVNGVNRRGLVKMDPVTGVIDTTFNARLDGAVREAEVVAGRLIVGGEFTKRLQAVDLATGADTGYIDLGITGDLDGPEGSWAPRVYRFSVDSTRTRLVAVGNFITVDGRNRERAFMVELGPETATLASWYYKPLRRECKSNLNVDYLRDVDFSPDGSWFVIVSSGFIPERRVHVGTSVCDAAARFETTGPRQTAPTWINYTGGDTIQATTVTTGAVYVQGHNRWLDNAGGRDTCVPGCAPRPGIGAIDPVTGKALPFNPTKDRGEGGKDLLLTNHGLWVPSDTTVIGGETHERLALLPAS